MAAATAPSGPSGSADERNRSAAEPERTTQDNTSASRQTAAGGLDAPIPEINGNSQPFGATLAPVLEKACGGRLSDIRWFRTDWQRGGALTGYAVYQADGARHAVVVKLPVPPGELAWLRRLQGTEDVVPKLYADGDTLGGYDMAWVVMECLPHGPLGTLWEGREFDLIVEAAGRFYAATAAFEVKGDSDRRDWRHILELARKSIQTQRPAEHARWTKALKKAKKKMEGWLKVWADRPVEGWCHGDLHLANAMTRQPPPQGPAVLLDLALVRPGHWVEDAVYLEHLFWSRSQRVGDRKLARQIAQERKKRDLPVESDWAELANIKRSLLAIAAAADLRHNDARHLEAALDVLESQVG